MSKKTLTFQIGTSVHSLDFVVVLVLGESVDLTNICSQSILILNAGFCVELLPRTEYLVRKILYLLAQTLSLERPLIHSPLSPAPAWTSESSNVCHHHGCFYRKAFFVYSIPARFFKNFHRRGPCKENHQCRWEGSQLFHLPGNSC